MSVQFSRKIVLLDLDGTLTRSDPGILASVRYAYQHNGIPVPDEKTLNSFIGPAIMSSMQRCGVSKQQLPAMVRSYREAYNTDVFDDPNHPGLKVPGMYLNSVYDGIPEALNNLRDDGYDLYVCTAKPEYQAQPICDRFGLTPLVDGVYGASEDSTRIHKYQVVAYTLEKIGYKPESDQLAVMVGDRWTDVDGARDGGHLDTIGARWGYADPGELEQHGAAVIAETTADLEQTVNGYFDQEAAQRK